MTDYWNLRPPLRLRAKQALAIARRADSENGNFGLHRFAEPLVAFRQLLERPVERADGVRRRKNRQRESVPFFLILSQRPLTARKDRGGGSFRIAQRIGYTVRGQRIPEEAGIANQHPARAVRLPEPAGRAPECFKALDTIGNCVCPESGRQPIAREL